MVSIKKLYLKTAQWIDFGFGIKYAMIVYISIMIINCDLLEEDNIDTGSDFAKIEDAAEIICNYSRECIGDGVDYERCIELYNYGGCRGEEMAFYCDYYLCLGQECDKYIACLNNCFTTYCIEGPG